jgi:lysozyme family protein
MEIAQTRRDIINRVVGIEGDYVNDSRDSGGATKYGITAETAGHYGIADVSGISVDQAFDIYIRGYWDKMSLDHVAVLSPELAEELFEQSVNMGNARPTEWLQRMLNVLNDGGSYYPDIKIDREMGEKTILALTAFLKRRGERGIKVLVNGLNAYQSTFYFDLAGRREKDEAFAFGWQSNRVGDTAIDPADIVPTIQRPTHDANSPVAVAPLPTPPPNLPPLYYVTDSNGETLGVWDKAPPPGAPDSYIRENGINYPLYTYKAPKPPLIAADTAIETGIHGGLLSIAATGLAAALGVDVGIAPDVGTAIAAGGGIRRYIT